ncbi:hypothetical protein ACIQZG_12345 [Lysinibacillus sp. NPDC096418]|uniref:hypothetical protein n=1 Tax=Lysinibacillus sp. NPDC096418 TaxID=3364138 RepID=UPI0038004F63
MLIVACLFAACTNNEEIATTEEDVATEVLLPQSFEDLQSLVYESESYLQTTNNFPVIDK